MEYYKAINFQDFILCCPEIDDFELNCLENENLPNIKGEKSKSNIRYDGENYFLYEWKVYHVIGKADNPLLEENFLHVGEYRKHNTGILFFKNFVGDSRFKNQRFVIESDKMKTEEVYELIDLVDRRVRQTISLNFSSQAISRGEFHKNPDRYKNFYIYQKLFLSLRKGNIISNIKRIQKFPNRIFETNRETVSLSVAENISENSLIDIFSGETLLIKSNNSRIARKFYGIVPKNINEYNNKISIDTNENRFIKFFVHFCIRILSKFIEDLTNDKDDNYSGNVLLIEEVQQFRDELQKQLRSPFFNEISSINTINHSSTILTRQFGYKQVYQEFINLKQSPINIFDSKSLIELFENKSIDKLYEYICLFRLVDIMTDIYRKASTEKIKTVDNQSLYSVGLSEKNGGVEFIFEPQNHLPYSKIMFQHSFNRSNGGAYSVEFKPDFSLQIIRGGEEINYHFDSKFRMNKDNLSKNDDIVKMHSYKDGIINTLGAFVLFPGDEATSYFLDNSKQISGVGAYPLNIHHENDILIKSLIEKCLIDS